MIKAVRVCWGVFVMIPLLLFSGGNLDVNISAESAVLMDADTGSILYEKNAFQVRYPASTTKIATALFALVQKGNQLEELVTVTQDSIGSISPEMKRKSGFKTPPHWIEVGGTHMVLKRGEKMSLNDLLYGVLLVSANDASNAVANFVSGSVPRFMRQMNAYLKEIGCMNTNFNNPHGLFHPEHTTTAYDMALIMQEFLRYPHLKKIIATVKHKRPKTNLQEPSWLINSTRMIRPNSAYYYKHLIGGKTGYTEDAKNCFAAAAESNGRTLIVIVLGCSSRANSFKDAKNLFEAGFNQKKIREKVLNKGPQKFKTKLSASNKILKTACKEDVWITYFSAERPQLKGVVCWDIPNLPIEKGDQVGTVLFRNENGVVVEQTPLYAANQISLPLTSRLAENKSLVLSGIGGGIALLSLYVFRRKKRKN